MKYYLLLAIAFPLSGCKFSGQNSAANSRLPASASPLVEAIPSGLMGYAMEGGMATTGGAGGATVTVTTAAELASAVLGTTPKIIQVSGILNGNNGYAGIGSNKTIVGLKGSEIRNYGLYMFGSSNVILQNLKMYDGNGDYSPFSIKEGSHHVWIDHCEFYGSDIPDNNHTMASILREAQYITISWTKFSSKFLGLLIGAANTDMGPFYVTIHHSMFENLIERQPKVRNGKVHVFNTYYKNAMTAGHTPFGITAVVGATVRTDNNYFENFKGHAITTEYDYPNEGRGWISGIETNYKDSVGDFFIPTEASNWKPPYDYEKYLTPVMLVPNLVLKNVGATLK